MAGFAKAGNTVFGIDISQSRTDYLTDTHEPDFFEPGLSQLLKQYKDKISFTTDYSHVRECDAVLITVGTPLKEDGSPNYDYLAMAMQIGPHIKKGCTVILKSTVTPGTTEHYVVPRLESLSGLRAGVDFYVAFCPERVIEGNAVHELATLPKIIGGINAESMERTARIIGQLGGQIVRVSSPTVAELCKLADNTYRAMNITFANEIGVICEKLGIDAYEVVSAVNNSYARTRLFKPGLGADGPCLYKDCQIFRSSARENSAGSPIMDACAASSDRSTSRLVALVSDFIGARGIRKPEVSIAGLAFKGEPETDDIRESAALKIYDAFRQKDDFSRISFRFYDPLISKFCGREVCHTLDECVQGTNVLLLLTNHPVLMKLDIHYLAELIGRPALVVDCWHNLMDPNALEEESRVEVFQIGSRWKSIAPDGPPGG